MLALVIGLGATLAIVLMITVGQTVKLRRANVLAASANAPTPGTEVPAASTNVPVSSADVSAARESELQIPQITFHYSYHLDFWTCGDKSKDIWGRLQRSSVKREWVAELLRKIPEFQRDWDRQGTPLLKEAARLVGKPWPWREQHAALYLCKEATMDLLAGSPLPAQFAVWMYLNGPMREARQKPWSMLDFISGVFHEFLHLYVSKTAIAPEGMILKEDSKLNKEFVKAGGSELAMTHLHLHALQFQVFKNLDRQDLIDETLKLYDTYLPDYRASWDEAAKNPDAYIDEMRQILVR